MNRGRIGQGRLGQTIERCQNRRTAKLHSYSDTESPTAYSGSIKGAKETSAHQQSLLGSGHDYGLAMPPMCCRDGAD